MRGAVLAGGAARRYSGRPKGLLQVGGRRMLDRVVETVATVIGASPLVIANADDAASWRSDLTTIPDLRPNCGSLGGIYTAVVAGDGPVLCVAWDMPFVNEALLRALTTGLADWDAFLPESAGPRGLEPLCAVYGPACRRSIERRLDAGDLAAIAFHADVRVGILPDHEVRRCGNPDELFFNVNTPEDLARADAMAAHGAKARPS